MFFITAIVVLASATRFGVLADVKSDSTSTSGGVKQLVDHFGNVVNTSVLANFLRSAYNDRGSGLVLVGHHYMPEEYDWLVSEPDSSAEARIFNGTMDLDSTNEHSHDRANYLHVLYDLLAHSNNEHPTVCYITSASQQEHSGENKPSFPVLGGTEMNSPDKEPHQQVQQRVLGENKLKGAQVVLDASQWLAMSKNETMPQTLESLQQQHWTVLGENEASQQQQQQQQPQTSADGSEQTQQWTNGGSEQPQQWTKAAGGHGHWTEQQWTASSSPNIKCLNLQKL